MVRQDYPVRLRRRWSPDKAPMALGGGGAVTGRFRNAKFEIRKIPFLGRDRQRCHQTGFQGAVGPAAPERLAWLETPLRRVGSLLKGIGQSPPPLAASKSAAIGQCQVGGPPRWEHHHFQVGVLTRWEYHHTVHPLPHVRYCTTLLLTSRLRYDC